MFCSTMEDTKTRLEDSPKALILSTQIQGVVSKGIQSSMNNVLNRQSLTVVYVID
jgi:hypothetical protein